jgi:hypothetical protein
MPAIEFERLEKEISEIARYIADPSRVGRSVRELLEFYGRGSAIRVSSRKAPDDMKSFGTPQVVIMELQRALRSRLSQDPTLGPEIAQFLWEDGHQESRILGIRILLDSWDAKTPNTFAEWINESEDREVLRALALGWLEQIGIRTEDKAVAEIFDRIRANRRVNLAFCALVVQAALNQPDFDDIPIVLQMTDRLLSETKGELADLVEEILRVLARRSPQETTQFLVDRIEKEPISTRRMIRRVLSSFPDRQQSVLVKSISR